MKDYYKALAIECPKCKAGEGRSCVRLTGGWLIGRPLRDKVHRERTAAYRSSITQKETTMSENPIPNYKLLHVAQFIDMANRKDFLDHNGDRRSGYAFKVSVVLDIEGKGPTDVPVLTGHIDPNSDGPSVETISAHAFCVCMGIAIGRGTDLDSVPLLEMTTTTPVGENNAEEENVTTH